MQGYLIDEKKFVRELATLVFCHVWAAFLKPSIVQKDEAVSTSVSGVREVMEISPPEILATVSIALMSLAKLASPWLVRWEPTSTHSANEPSWQSCYTTRLLKYVQERALRLALADGLHFDFMKAFLEAYAIVNTPQVPSPLLNLQYVRAFIKEYSNISMSFNISEAPELAPPAGFPAPSTRLIDSAFRGHRSTLHSAQRQSLPQAADSPPYCPYGEG
jgi:hypothetical protein